MKVRPTALHPRAFSMVETIVSIAVIGIMSAIALQSFSGVREQSQLTVAETMAETLNQGVNKYSQLIGTSIYLTADDSASTNEVRILRSLQWDHGTGTASPYVRPDYNPSVSSDTSTFRLEWNGGAFAVLEPGTSGTGLRVDFESNDLTTEFSFPSDYTPLDAF